MSYWTENRDNRSGHPRARRGTEPRGTVSPSSSPRALEVVDFWSRWDTGLPAHHTQLGEKHLTFPDVLSPFPACTHMRGWHQGGCRLAALSFIWNIKPRSCTVLNINHPLVPMKKSYGFY